ncbi:TIGR01777 family oxidoreductase [Spirosoma pulveris]
MKTRKIILAGGSGFVGQLLIDYWQHAAVDIVVLARRQYADNGRIRYVVWDGETLGAWVQELDQADVVINLSGKSVDCRYTTANKELIIRSRVNSTRVLGEGIRLVQKPPHLWINAASATIYRHAPDRPMDELTGDIDNGLPEHEFSVQVCKRWEETFRKANTPETVRKVALRMAIVLGKKGGVFPVLKRLVRFGLGGKMGNGDQFISWLHEQDLGRIFDFIIENDFISGTLNATSPNPVRNHQFMTLLRQSLTVPFGLPAAEWMLKVGALFLRTETELILKSRNVVPKRLLDAGFTFAYPNVQDAIKALTAR